MPLNLRIENFTSLPDGGPLTFTMRGQTRADIGRDQHLDWCLPDTERFISSKHCELRFEKGEYLLDDVSTNGTFVNGSAARVQSPYRLKDGDRLQIGEYLVTVALTRDDDAYVPAQPVYTPEPRPEIDRPSSYGSLWDVEGDVAPAVDPKQFRPRAKASPVYGDFLYHAADVPRVTDDAQFAPADSSMDWAAATPRKVEQADAPRAPEPRRRAVRDESAWDDAPPVAEPAAPPAAFDDPSPPAPPEREQAPVAPVIVAPVVQAPPPPVPRAAPPEPPAPAPRAVPEPPPPMPVAIGPMPAVANPAADSAFMGAFAQAAGLPPDVLRRRPPDEIGRMLGGLLVAMTEGMQQLLQARTRAKQSARSSEHTLIQPQENNPLKFSPTPQDALQVMLGPPTRSYLDAQRAFANGLEDLKRHQVQTYSAMQGAVTSMIAEFDPAKIEKDVPQAAAISAIVKSRKAQLWDAYVAAWAAQKGDQREEVIRRYMTLFGNHYDKAGDRG